MAAGCRALSVPRRGFACRVCLWVVVFNELPRQGTWAGLVHLRERRWGDGSSVDRGKMGAAPLHPQRPPGEERQSLAWLPRYLLAKLAWSGLGAEGLGAAAGRHLASA